MTINELIQVAHADAKAKGWWDEERNIGEALMLIVSECGEALEAHRNGRMGDLQQFDARYPERNCQLSEEASLEFIGGFGFRTGREVEKFDGVPYSTAQSGCPYPDENVVAFIDLRVAQSLDVDTHTVFICELVDCGITGQGTPMTYSYYREVLCGKTPPTAPSYKKETAAPAEDSAGRGSSEMNNDMTRYVCAVCGYIYDPEIGDPNGKVPPGTPFEDLPDNWECPVCGVGKMQFNPE